MLLSVAEWTSARLKQTFNNSLKNPNALINIKLPVLFILNTDNFLSLASVLHYYYFFKNYLYSITFEH